MRTCLITTALTLLVCIPARSATLDIEVTPPSSVNHEFSGFYGLQNFLNMDAGPITTNISDYDTIRYQMQMAPQQSIFVDVPAGETVIFLLDVNLTVPLSSLDSTLTPPTTIDFLGLSGTSPTFIEGGLRVRENGNQMDLRARYDATAPFSFNGFRAVSTGPFNDNGEKTLVNQYGASLLFRYFPPTDMGLFVSIVPEPTSLALLSLSGLLMGRRRRH